MHTATPSRGESLHCLHYTGTLLHILLLLARASHFTAYPPAGTLLHIIQLLAGASHFTAYPILAPYSTYFYS